MTAISCTVIPTLVSTIIPVYNRSSMLVEAVDSVLAQSHRSIEIIVSDDGSSDDTPAVARKLVEAHPDLVRYVRNPNRGPGPAREAGRLLARGEFIQYLDSDDRLLPEKFSLQIAALRDRPDCGVAYGYTRLVDGEGRCLREPFKWTAEDRDTLFPGLLVDRWWCTHTPLYRRSVTDAIGAWSDLRYSQDWEYDARVGALGTRLVNCHAYVSEHRHHGAQRQTGTGKWLAPDDRARFFGALLEHARRAGVDDNTPELRHFSRWAFQHARECGASGASGAASRLLAIARDASGGRSRDISAYGWLARVIGWKASAIVSARAGAWVGRRQGSDSLRQSWME